MIASLFFVHLVGANANAAIDQCQLAEQGANALRQVEARIERQTLANGLQLMLLPMPAQQTVAIATEVDVGSRHEQSGETGYAHLFEHLLFEGSENAPGEAYTQAMRQLGGQFNAETWFDYTRYYIQFPAHALNRVLWLEADRFRRPVLSDKTVENQKAAVLEETAMRVDNTPFFRASMEFMLQQMAGTPYEHDVLGRREDIVNATPASLSRFHQRHYFPANARIALTGQFEVEQANQWLQQQFGDWHNPSELPPDDAAITVEPTQTEATLTDSRSPWPALLLAWHTVGLRHPDRAAIDLFERHLLGMPDNRLEQSLRQEDSTFIVQSIALPMADHGLSNLVLVPRAHKSLDDLEQTVLQNIAEVAEQGLSTERLCQLKADHIEQQLRRLDDPLQLASALVANSERFPHTPLTGQWQNIQSLTSADLQRVAKQYFQRQPIRLELQPAWYMRVAKTLLEWLPESWAKGLEDSAL